MRRPQTIGLLGGSFNPAHAGHVHISLEAKKRLGLDAVWWLVSPQNPLKSSWDMADFSLRLHHAAHIAAPHAFIHVSDIEHQLGTRYTVDTLKALQQRYPHTRFIWLMGADNLAQIHRWKRWTDIFSRIPVIVLDRMPAAHHALRSKAALRYRNRRLDVSDARAVIASPSLPCWAYLFIPRHGLSATQLRKTLGKKAFLAHNRKRED